MRLTWVAAAAVIALSSYAYGRQAAQLTTPGGYPIDSALVNAISGSITQAGRTLVPTTLTYAAVAVGGTPTTMPAVDTKSGPANIGDDCEVVSATATPLPSSLRFTCAITASGVASIMAYPTLGVGLGAQSVSVNVFWRG